MNHSISLNRLLRKGKPHLHPTLPTKPRHLYVQRYLPPAAILLGGILSHDDDSETRGLKFVDPETSLK